MNAEHRRTFEDEPTHCTGRPAGLDSVQHLGESHAAEPHHRNSWTSSFPDELRTLNARLVAELAESQRQSAELTQMVTDLEHTNNRVSALCEELREELGQTDQGVVVLYAELDDKSAQLKEASEAKSRFLASVSHELRTPVNSIIGLARLLLEPGVGQLEAEQRRQVELIASSGTDLLGLVNALLDLAKAESNRLEPETAPVDLREVFHRLRDTLRPVATSPLVELQIAEYADFPRLVTDELMLTQILRNLLANGLKFTDQGYVRLTVEPDPATETVVFTVTDTGIGIPLTEQQRIFEEFYQVRGPHQVRTNGTGLGLAYVRRLTSVLHGELTLDSSPGRGSSFRLRLPVGALPEPVRPASATLRLEDVLLADDDPAFVEIIRSSLRGVVRDFRAVGDGVQLMDAVRERTPDAVLLDIRMPKMDGVAVLAELDEDPLLRALPVVVVVSTPLDNLPAPLFGRRNRTLLSKTGIGTQTLLAALGRVTNPEVSHE